jgi:hypothetical protein
MLFSVNNDPPVGIDDNSSKSTIPRNTRAHGTVGRDLVELFIVDFGDDDMTLSSAPTATRGTMYTVRTLRLNHFAINEI